MPLSIVQSDFVDVNIPTIVPQTQQIFTTVGTSTWTRPTGCTKVKVTVIGGGGGAGGNWTKAQFNGHIGINGAGGGGGGTVCRQTRRAFFGKWSHFADKRAPVRRALLQKRAVLQTNARRFGARLSDKMNKGSHGF